MEKTSSTTTTTTTTTTDEEDRSEWLKKRHEQAMKKNQDAKEEHMEYLKKKYEKSLGSQKKNETPPKNVPNLSERPVNGLGSDGAWRRVIEQIGHTEKNMNYDDYGKGYELDPNDSDNTFEDDENNEEDDDMQDYNNPFKVGTNDYKNYAKEKRKRTRKRMREKKAYRPLYWEKLKKDKEKAKKRRSQKNP